MLNCDHCGEIDHVLLDGYPVGDTLLEGVMFEARRNESDKYYVVNISKAHESYFNKLNTQMWLAEMFKYANETDIAQCHKCKRDVEINKGE